MDDHTTDDDIEREQAAGAEEDGMGEGADDATPDEPPQNLLTRLRQRRAAAAEAVASGNRKLVLPVPQYDEELLLEFTYAPDAYDRLKAIGKKALASRHPRRELYVAMDTLIFACTNVLVPKEVDGEVRADFDYHNPDHTEGIDPEGQPVGFHDPLPALLDFTVQTGKGEARRIVSKVFNNDLAIMAVADKVGKWMQGEEEETDADF